MVGSSSGQYEGVGTQYSVGSLLQSVGSSQSEAESRSPVGRRKAACGRGRRPLSHWQLGHCHRTVGDVRCALAARAARTVAAPRRHHVDVR